MPSLSIQFYAEREELIQCVVDWQSRFSFTVTLAYEKPTWQARTLNGVDAQTLFKLISDERVSSVYFNMARPNLTAGNGYGFILANPDSLSLSFGNNTENGLEQSWLSGKTSDAELYRKWQSVARSLKKITKAGLWATNSNLEKFAFYRNFRYSAGAEKLSNGGTPLYVSPSVTMSVKKPEIE